MLQVLNDMVGNHHFEKLAYIVEKHYQPIGGDRERESAGHQ